MTCDDLIDSEALRDLLWSAVRRCDVEEFEAICSRCAAEIIAAFPRWKRVPEAVSPQEVRTYCDGLLALAQHFEAAGQPQLIESLCGDDNPRRRWLRALEGADALSNAGDPEAAFKLVHAAVGDLETHSGTGVDRLRGMIFGRLGKYRYHAHDFSGAGIWLRRALAECERVGDAEGIQVYTRDLSMLERLTQRKSDDG